MKYVSISKNPYNASSFDGSWNNDDKKIRAVNKPMSVRAIWASLCKNEDDFNSQWVEKCQLENYYDKYIYENNNTCITNIEPKDTTIFINPTDYMAILIKLYRVKKKSDMPNQKVKQLLLEAINETTGNNVKSVICRVDDANDFDALYAIYGLTNSNENELNEKDKFVIDRYMILNWKEIVELFDGFELTIKGYEENRELKAVDWDVPSLVIFNSDCVNMSYHTKKIFNIENHRNNFLR